MSKNDAFWNLIDQMVESSQIVIDREKGTSHPKYPETIYEVDYGYLKNTTSMDGAGIDVWRGTANTGRVNAVICIVDLLKRDSEIKLLIGCTEEEKEKIEKFHNRYENMKGILINREE
ncbi:MAG: inorganic pyrophosphatase [Clostridia bacterium]|nr:inorganic pyrophosphatase [Clostridia bacterium]